MPEYQKNPVDRVLFLQRTIGNQAVQRLIKSGRLQAKLKIGQPGDKYEQDNEIYNRTGMDKSLLSKYLFVLEKLGMRLKIILLISGSDLSIPISRSLREVIQPLL